MFEQIDDTPVYMANFVHTPTGSPRFASIPESLKPLIEQLKPSLANSLDNRIAIKIDAGERFLAKLALGFGSLLLHPSFVESEDATKLRNYLWRHKAEDREALKLHGTGFFDNFAHGESRRNLNDVIGWKPGHVIVLQVFDRLALSVMFYGSQSATIVVSSTPEHWEGRIAEAGGSGGTVFLVAPGFRRALGPVPLSRYIAASNALKLGNVLYNVGAFLHQVESHPSPPLFELEEPESGAA